MRQLFRLTSLLLILLIQAAIIGTLRGELRGEEGQGKNPLPAEITPAEIEIFAKEIIKATTDSDIKAFNALIDWETLTSEATAIPKPDDLKIARFLEQARAGFKDGMLKSINGETGLGGKCIAAVKGGGSFRMLRSGRDGQRPFAFMRLIFPDDNGHSYCKLYLARNKSGKIVVVDFYPYLTGELLTETIRRSWTITAAHVQARYGGTQNKDARTFLTYFSKMGQLSRLVDQKKYGEALKLYATLPEQMRRDKVFLIHRMRAAQEFSDKEYEQAIADLKKYHPDNPANDFLAIDGYCIHDRFEEALRCTEAVDSDIGGDPYLKTLQAGLLTKLGRHDQAITNLKLALRDEPSLNAIYSIGLNTALAAKDHELTLKILDKLDRLNLLPEDIDTDPDFSDFRTTPQFQKWSKRDKN